MLFISTFGRNIKIFNHFLIGRGGAGGCMGPVFESNLKFPTSKIEKITNMYIFLSEADTI
jgi:hypothetical protein